jgi:ATP-dependent RNA helicase DHX57
VSEERNEKVGMTVGYSIRGESRSSRNTKLQFVTTGVLLRRLLIDPELNSVSHVIVDEVHERTVDGDFLLLLLKQLLLKRMDLTIVLMSATVEANEYTRYFSDFTVAHVHIEGRTFPVQDRYLEDVLKVTGYRLSHRGAKQDLDTETNDFEEGLGTTLKILNEGKLDYELIAKTVDLVCEKGQDYGGILIFLPGKNLIPSDPTIGIAEIFQCVNSINKLNCAKGLQIIPLHASLPPQEQKRVFSRPPAGIRKVIVSTNVAETSITVDDVTVVIDTGRVKQLTYNPNTNIVCLGEQWTSRASAKQRRGRAGRVTPGTCYKLFSKLVEQSKMDERTSPEIQRIPLEQLCLSALGMGWNDVIGLLSKTLSPPKIEALERAMRTLKDVGALDGESLSALGRHMSAIPADLRCSKLMILGSIFGCLSATLTIASIIAVKSPFVSPSDKRDAAAETRKRFSNGSGDLLTDAKAFNVWSTMQSEKGRRLTRKWCDEVL